jgi:hypothetical protein
MIWYFEDYRRYRREREVLEALASSADWLIPIGWRVDGELHMIWDADIVAPACVRPISLRYPNHLWLSRKQRRRFHQRRLRREVYGELIQIDGSEHRWFEDRGAPCSLLVFIDDATGKLMHSTVCAGISKPTAVPLPFTRTSTRCSA